jgi:hypothetical protein
LTLEMDKCSISGLAALPLKKEHTHPPPPTHTNCHKEICN